MVHDLIAPVLSPSFVEFLSAQKQHENAFLRLELRPISSPLTSFVVQCDLRCSFESPFVLRVNKKNFCPCRPMSFDGVPFVICANYVCTKYNVLFLIQSMVF